MIQKTINYRYLRYNKSQVSSHNKCYYLILYSADRDKLNNAHRFTVPTLNSVNLNIT